MNSYAVGAVLGELWLTVTTATSITTYKAYAKVLSGGAGAALRFLNGTYEESLATLNVGSSIRLEGTLEYRTGYVADEVSLPKIWTPKGFSENIAGYVGLNNMAVPARARLDIVETEASNLPVLILDQRGSGPLLEMRSNMDDVKLIVDLQGNVGIGTSVARTKLEVAGHVWPSSNLAYDLGSSNLRWRDLYLSGNTIDLGGTFLTRNAEGGGIKVTSDNGEDVDTSSRNVNASGYVNVNGTRLERHVTGPLMVKTGAGEGVMESGMFKHVYVDGTVRASNLEILGGNVGIGTSMPRTKLEVAGHIWPSSNQAYDIGSSILRWRDLYLGGNTIDLGGTFITSSNSGGISILDGNGFQDTSIRNLNASGYVNLAGTRLERHATGSLMVRNATGDMESGMFKNVFVNGTVQSSNVKITQNNTNTPIAEFYKVDGTLSMTISETGNIGIGTTQPLSKWHVHDTGAIILPVGTTQQQPTSAIVGMLRYNTTTNRLQYYSAFGWASIGGISAQGGNSVFDSNGYRIHIFTSSGTFNMFSGGFLETLVVAGGGGGGNGSSTGYESGGGGAGGLIFNQSYLMNSGSYNIVIGAGGAGDTNGQNSTFHTLTAIGGGKGATSPNGGGNGGSGGGGSHSMTTGGLGTSGQGNNGSTPISTSRGGGGGGAGASGNGSGPGGTGLQISISNTNSYYAGGGGGVVPGQTISGGLGGGGSAPGTLNTNGSDGSINTGGGGGGAYGQSSGITGGNGGSGIVIIRYNL
jgi:hypothetical protein